MTSSLLIAVGYSGPIISVEVALASGEVTLAGASLSGEYKLQHFNFHWGSSDNVGSEHTVAGRHYPLEVSECQS